ncbi:MAG: MaoC family dehydratase [Pseudomonadota bacterium]|nr:MaoC family dehydratase [Pseudomonadota bacterium]
MPYYIEDLKPGMSESFSHTVTERDIEMFGEVSGDMNPAHFDAAFAATTPFKTRIAHGVLSSSYISTVLGMKMPGPGAIFISLTTRFKAPVRIGDTVTATCTVKEVVAEKRRVSFDCNCKVGDTVVVEGEAVVMPPARPKA